MTSTMTSAKTHHELDDPWLAEGHVTLRWAQATDDEALHALFRRAFGGDISTAEWRWKYPHPGGLSLLAMRAGRVIAHYGGQTRQLSCLGQSLAAVQVSDIMVDPGEPATLGRNTPFRAIATTFAATTSGPGRTHAFVFGFPSPRASRLGERLGMYTRVDTLRHYRWPTAGRRVGRLRRLTPAELMEHGDMLWQRQAARLADDWVLGVRDAAWIRQRYVEHPSDAYAALASMDIWGRMQAAALFREREATWELIDLLGEPRHYRRLVLGLGREAHIRAGKPLIGWLTPAVLVWLPEPRSVVSDGGGAGPEFDWLPVTIAGPEHQSWAPQLKDHCWMTGGDTDYR